MADGQNLVLLLGNLGADPELRMSANGNAVLRCRLATSKTFLDRNRVKQERTEWHSVTIFGRRGEALARILSKGSRIQVTGEIRYSNWEGDDGQKRYRTDIIAQNVILCGGASRSGQGASSGHSSSSGGEYGGYDDADFGGDNTDDDIPF